MIVTIERLDASAARRCQTALAEVLADCVNGGASVNFMLPFSVADAERFFETVIADIAAGRRLLLAAFLDARLVGTVQLVVSTPPNQPHRAEVAKLLVHRSARNLGVATGLMRHLEDTARSVGKTLLVLDTVTGMDAERLYTRLGWKRAGVIPRYALFPDGAPCDTTIFWKDLSSPVE